jgi:hypothetical protein
MDPFWVAFFIALGIALLVLGSEIRTRSLRSLDRRRELQRRRESGRVGWIVLWLLGVPIPILLVLYLLRGCT